jgi:GxxExxY protein
MENKRVSTPYDDLTYKIIGCAMKVHRNLGPGLREDSYQYALALSLLEAKLNHEQQRNYCIYDDKDRQQFVGYYIPDFVVEEKVIVEIKALQGIDNSHLAQVIGYLAVSKCPLGLLINFGERSLRYRRVFPPKNICEHTLNRQWLFAPNWLKGDEGK